MAALTRDRDTPRRGPATHQFPKKQATATTIHGGSMVCENAGGFALPASDTAGLQQVCGRAVHRSVNAGADGAVEVVVESGIFKYANGGNIVQASVGGTCTVVDDQTVNLAAQTANDIIAGRIVAVDSDGVWVAVGVGEGLT